MKIIPDLIIKLNNTLFNIMFKENIKKIDFNY